MHGVILDQLAAPLSMARQTFSSARQAPTPVHSSSSEEKQTKKTQRFLIEKSRDETDKPPGCTCSLESWFQLFRCGYVRITEGREAGGVVILDRRRGAFAGPGIAAEATPWFNTRQRLFSSRPPGQGRRAQLKQELNTPPPGGGAKNRLPQDPGIVCLLCWRWWIQSL